ARIAGAEVVGVPELAVPAIAPGEERTIASEREREGTASGHLRDVGKAGDGHRRWPVIPVELTAERGMQAVRAPLPDRAVSAQRYHVAAITGDLLSLERVAGGGRARFGGDWIRRDGGGEESEENERESGPEHHLLHDAMQRALLSGPR